MTVISARGAERAGSSEPQIGRPLRRREDVRLITGAGCYVADVPLQDPLHVAFVRSPVPGGRIAGCETEAARDMPGVAQVVSAADLGELGTLGINPVLEPFGSASFPVLAGAHVCAVGQPVAAVLADTPGQALDACDAVPVDVEDDDGAAEPAGFRGTWSSGDCDAVMAGAAHRVSVTVDHPRLAPASLEPRGIAVAYHGESDSVTVFLSTQTPHRARRELSRILSVAPERIHVAAPDVGGAFGMKASLYPEEVLCVWAALRFKRATRWIASRGEDFLAASHGRGAKSEGTLGVDADGRFEALRASVTSPLGHWLPSSAAIPAWNAGRILPGGYLVGAVDIRSSAETSNTAAVGIYRGAGRPEANCLMERLVDAAASATGIDPLEIRKRNMIPPERFPYTGPTGVVLDSGRYAELLDQLADETGYQSRRAAVAKRRAGGEVVGLGVAFYIEPCGTGWESARVTRNPDGTVLVAFGGSTQGHGRETALAQIAADALGLGPEAIDVVCGSTQDCPTGIGALASRSTAIGGSAVLKACEALLARVDSGADTSVPVSEEVVYEAAAEAWGYGAYLVQIAIDAETGDPTLEYVACVDDAGTVINPMLVEGQIRGGFAQGIGEALMERLVYDGDGQLVTGSLMDYALPRAGDIPALAISKIETRAPNNPLGAKGVGEAGTIGAPAAILNAAIDALRPHGVTDLPMPLTSETLWRALHRT
ncbi:xanthine dehydrogenase family protein molybdopterin-binding subunit [Stappia sp. ES.058]|uniref:xanthine dehydrogenase family protein molybdopterin-binding subunit n=1 Tax=Stappia sp. ES.058 TaxID=1881061 RepID=UPI000879B2C4|nr:xanthine dehydrogenase family protein molybdopterin-binding subunit [Stappia sp. ES.058]SDU31493.1 xanthine dehydrogenase, molybdenum binding subunit apoprotein [Stappia sp. ES.058]